MTQLLITGGAGYLGKGLARVALARGYRRVCIYSRDEAKHAIMRQEFNDDERLRFFVGCVREVDDLTRAMQGIEIVIHAAALKRVEVGEYSAGQMAKTNVLGTMNVIEAAERTKVRKVVFVSTDKACQASNCYGATKFVAEKLILAANNARGKSGPMFAAVRYGNVSGSTGSVIPTWRRELEQARPVRLTHPEATRFWMTRDHAVALVLDTAEKMKGGELEIPDLPAYRLGDLAAAMGVQFHVTGLGGGEKLHESMRVGETSAEARRMSVGELREALANV
jgi:UDP-N-acetylglucosamine 4,6-dehydratase